MAAPALSSPLPQRDHRPDHAESGIGGNKAERPSERASGPIGRGGHGPGKRPARHQRSAPS